MTASPTTWPASARVCLAPTCGLTHIYTEAFSQCRCVYCGGADLESAPWHGRIETEIRRAIDIPNARLTGVGND